MLELVLFFISIGAGVLGSLLGLGGGIIIVPVLTLGFGIHIRYAIAASLISIVATSSGAAAHFLQDRLTNLRLAVLLELGTVTGAIVGFLLSSYLDPLILFLIFGIFLLFSAISMLRKRDEVLGTNEHPWSKRLNLSGMYNSSKNELSPYVVEKVPAALFVMWMAGILSALLGIGSGIFKVLAMDGLMKLPIKVSSATSNFMIGVTAAGSAGAFLLRGDVRPEIAAPVALGIIVGAWFGARLMMRVSPVFIRRLFVIVLLIVAFQMIQKGVTKWM